ncbi:MAG: uracil-DNA glycosylase [Candidatus Paceibacterota bacterium]
MSNDHENRDEQLKTIRDELLNFTQSPLYEYRTQNNYFPVVGQGNHYATFMFIGEAPGKNEAQTGRPFCGAAGKILDKLLESVQIKREDVYITNIVKDRPQNNRDPEPEEIELYAPFLDRQIEIIKPKVIVTLGRFSMAYIMKRFGLAHELKPISTLHGTIHTSSSFVSFPITIIPMYHPAATIYNSQTKEQLFNDFQILKKYL